MDLKRLKTKVTGATSGGIYIFAGLVLCTVLQNASNILPRFFLDVTEFSRVSDETVAIHRRADISHLPAGRYYISVGRPRGPCDLYLDGKKLDSTHASSQEFRSALMLGAPLEIASTGEMKNADVTCSFEEGFAPGLTNRPMVMPLNWGLAVQAWAAITNVVLGPLVSILLLFVLFTTKGWDPISNRSNIFLGFAVAALFYSVSLAHLPRLFLSGLSASILHVVFRTIFSVALYCLFASYSRWRVFPIVGHILFVVGFIGAGICYIEDFDQIYTWCYPFFLLASAPGLLDIVSVGAKTRSGHLLRLAAGIWLFSQFLDNIANFSNFGAYMAPSVVATITVLAVLIRRNESEQDIAVEHCREAMMKIISSSLSMEEKLKNLAVEIKKVVPFDRYSVYSDMYTLGLYDRPLEKFIRVGEGGYLKETERDRFIDVRDGGGTYIKKALANGEALLNQGATDRTWFINIPIGSLVVINYSDHNLKPQYVAIERKTVIGRVSSALLPIVDQLVTYGTKVSYALETLRVIRGDRTSVEEIGSIFVDVNDYSEYMQNYGQDYGKFISTIYLPALSKRLRPWVVREGPSEGDAICLVCISDLMQDRMPVAAAMLKALEEIMTFVNGEGAEICRAQGYEPVRLQVGASIGIATVICDSFQARTSGQVVIDAKRVQQSAAPASVFVHASLAERIGDSDRVYVVEAKPGLVKISRFRRYQLLLKRQVGKNAA